MLAKAPRHTGLGALGARKRRGLDDWDGVPNGSCELVLQGLSHFILPQPF